jgi:heme A synthase
MNRVLHRVAVVLSLCTLLLIIDGAVAGQGEPHRAAAGIASLLILGLAIWLAKTGSRRLGGITLAIVTLNGVAGAFSPIAHAWLAPMLFAALVTVAVVSSPIWARGPELVRDYGWPSLRTLAIITPCLVLMQIALGAAFRHSAATLIPHVLGAMLVAVVILMQGIFVLQQFPAHPTLRPAAATLLGVGFAQVFLGITALIMRTMSDDTALPVVITVAAHIAGGALTLATTVALSVLIRRNVQPRVREKVEDAS